MDITVCTKEELAQAVLELTVELGKARRALNAALEVAKMDKAAKVKPFRENPAFGYTVGQSPCSIDPMAIDPRSVV